MAEKEKRSRKSRAMDFPLLLFSQLTVQPVVSALLMIKTQTLCFKVTLLPIYNLYTIPIWIRRDFTLFHNLLLTVDDIYPGL